MSKFKLGDEVVVIRIDEVFAQEQYDMIEWDYACTHFNKGIVIEVFPDKYTVQFAANITAYREWYYGEHELMSLEEFNKADKGKLEILYGRKEV